METLVALRNFTPQIYSQYYVLQPFLEGTSNAHLAALSPNYKNPPPPPPPPNPDSTRTLLAAILPSAIIMAFLLIGVTAAIVWFRRRERRRKASRVERETREANERQTRKAEADVWN